MRKLFLISIVFFSITQLWSQEISNTRIPVIGEQAPSFVARTTEGTLKFPSGFGKSWKILFSHPADFTPVCSSEILELAYLQEDFTRMNVKVLVVSTDSLETHFQWKKAMEELDYRGRGPVKINFPLADDRKYEISKSYGMIHAESKSTKDVRGVFIIDPNNVVQAIMYYPMTVGRNIDEIKRTISALQLVAVQDVATPANWTQGNDVLIRVLPAAGDLNQPANAGIYQVAWFMLFKKQ